jgi:hypothetical protein
LAVEEAYNVEEDKWEILLPMIQPHGLGCDGVFMEGKFMVFTRDGEVFDLSAGTWKSWENMGSWTGSWTGSLWTKSVYIYDFESARWSRGADMPTPRHSFSCFVDSSTGLVYVAGGVGLYVVGGYVVETGPLAAAEAYNVKEDKWEILHPMIQPQGLGCDGVFMEGKFLVFTEDISA